MRWRILAVAALSIGVSASASAQMKGDAEAVAAAKLMIETMGGAALWSKARWIYSQERAFFASLSEPAMVEFWRRTDAPEHWSRSVSKGSERRSAWTRDSGWRLRDGKVTEMSRADHQENLGWWPGEIYVMYARFARDDAGLRLVKLTERSWIVLDDGDGENLGEFHVNAAGELVAWKRSYGVDTVQYAYGPLKSIGPIRVPDWGTLHDGSFRFYYTDFRLTESDPPVSLQPPP